MNIWVPVRPRTHPRPRAQAGGGRSYMPKEYKEHLAECIEVIRDLRAGGAPIYQLEAKQVYVGMVIRPNGYEVILTPNNILRNQLRGDIDNYAKTMLDVLQHPDLQLIGNDKYVTHMVTLFGTETDPTVEQHVHEMVRMVA